MRYVDGFLLCVKKNQLKEYKKMAQLGAKIWMKHGALEYMEAMADDMSPAGVKVTFPKAAKAKPDEVVFFSFIVFKSRKHRDAVNKKVMADPKMQPEQYKDKPMPFDMKRFSYGGFKAFVEA